MPLPRRYSKYNGALRFHVGEAYYSKELVDKHARWDDEGEVFILLGAHFCSLTTDNKNTAHKPTLIGYYCVNTDPNLQLYLSLDTMTLASRAHDGDDKSIQCE